MSVSSRRTARRVGGGRPRRGSRPAPRGRPARRRSSSSGRSAPAAGRSGACAKAWRVGKPEQHPERARPRPAGTRGGAVGARPRSTASISSRQRSGAASTCTSANDTGRPMLGGEPPHPVDLAARARRRSSPAAPAGASSNTARPPCGHAPGRCRTARPRRRTCPAPARRPSARCPSVREVEKPSAPASIASCTIARHGGDVVGGGRLVRARRARPSRTRAPRRGRPACRCRCANVRPRRARRGTRGTSPSSTSMPSASAVPGMSSTPSIRPMSHSSAPGRTGANPTPQLPGDDGGDAVARTTASSSWSHVAWPS